MTKSLLAVTSMYMQCFISSLLTCRYGEIINVNLVRDKKTGTSKGFCFIGYEDQRSSIVAVDNFNGIKASLLHLTSVDFGDFSHQ